MITDPVLKAKLVAIQAAHGDPKAYVRIRDQLLAKLQSSK